MPRYEYKVLPAPAKGLKAKGVRGPEARFSNAIEALMNQMAEDGWEYQRAETLPSIERAGLTGSTTEWRNVLVFRRPRENDAAAFNPELLPPPDPAEIPEPETAHPLPEPQTLDAEGDDAHTAPDNVQDGDANLADAEDASDPTETAQHASADERDEAQQKQKTSDA